MPATPMRATCCSAARPGRCRGRGPTPTAVHTHGIRALSVRLRQPMSRLGFAMALGGLARDHGEKLLRVKGLVEFSDRPGGPAAIHAVQHTLYPPRWLEGWPDADRTSRLVFIVRDLEPDEILRRFVEANRRASIRQGVT